MHVTLRELGHRFGSGSPLFEGVSATLEPGRVYALTGPSGSGKSTLLGMLAGWITPTAGEVVREDVERVGWVFQNPHGVARRSALDHVVLPLIARGSTRSDAETSARALLARFGLGPAADRPFRALSGGEAQRLMLARGIATAPDLLLVDEPTAQLDQRTSAVVSDTLSRIATDGVIIVVATHDARTRDACTDLIDLGAPT
ncbi:ABC transporter ATP-binding protein [Leifsonia shinshuensis]|uniref:ABC-type lipoprotein export system ATPase subunit n=1 Tax=Leifsonia shinshuensis TaxID=150026 RepID=A0A853D085_9MICO|nr:ATP-binding cassette domain-containing protein [Leifsonia shinshuensis]NYJ24824.1 ABC-type lipoprotein export system ATPase subunit [Leifsonia shinshuensis]